ncbi:MAG: hypothetical protein RLZZ450_4244 [Pseudomonadota bacterium]|jgi:hypothetical protein
MSQLRIGPYRTLEQYAPGRMAEVYIAEDDDRRTVAIKIATLEVANDLLVELPLQREQAGRSVPRASVIYDASGAGWVYACAGDDAYQRARIDPIRLLGERLVFERGPELGACVASVGAAELFGSEFEPGH